MSASVEPSSWQHIAVDGAQVARSCSQAGWRVEEQVWEELLPGLPEDVVALLAPPVVVCAERLAPDAPVDPVPVVALSEPERPALVPPPARRPSHRGRR